MENVFFITATDPITGTQTEHAIIDNGNDEFTSMTRAYYESIVANRELAKDTFLDNSKNTETE